VVHDEEPKGQEEAQGQGHERGADRIAVAARDLLADGGALRGARQAVGPHGRQGEDHGHEAQAVEAEGRSGAIPVHHEAGDSGAHHAGAADHAGIEGDGIREVLLARHLHDERLPRGHIEGEGQAITGGQDRHVPVLHDARPHEDGQDKGLAHEGRLRSDEDAALGEAVRDGAGHEGEAEHGRRLERADEPQPERRVGELEDQPGLRHTLHPGADERDELAREEEAKVPMIEGTQSGWESHR
jgi:hypothetical protein